MDATSFQSLVSLATNAGLPVVLIIWALKWLMPKIDVLFNKHLTTMDFVQTTQIKMQETQTKMQETQTKMQESQDKMQESQTKMQETQTKMQESQDKMQESQERMQENQTKILAQLTNLPCSNISELTKSMEKQFQEVKSNQKHKEDILHHIEDKLK